MYKKLLFDVLMR